MSYYLRRGDSISPALDHISLHSPLFVLLGSGSPMFVLLGSASLPLNSPVFFSVAVYYLSLGEVDAHAIDGRLVGVLRFEIRVSGLGLGLGV